jgi:hypothetical protein
MAFYKEGYEEKSSQNYRKDRYSKTKTTNYNNNKQTNKIRDLIDGKR